MGHLTSKDAYKSLEDRLNWFTQGAPSSETLTKILNVLFSENVREKPAFMCNCCGCCCEALQAARKFGPMHPIETTNYISKVSLETCISCGKCAKKCPVLAISMQEKKPVIDESICLGCRVCARSCPAGAMHLERRPVQVITPVNSTHRFVVEAIEKGTLQNLIFDNQAFANHRAMAAVFGTILKLPPLKQALASSSSLYIWTGCFQRS